MTGIPSESRQPTEFQKMRLQLSGLVVRPASLKPVTDSINLKVDASLQSLRVVLYRKEYPE